MDKRKASSRTLELRAGTGLFLSYNRVKKTKMAQCDDLGACISREIAPSVRLLMIKRLTKARSVMHTQEDVVREMKQADVYSQYNREIEACAPRVHRLIAPKRQRWDDECGGEGLMPAAKQPKFPPTPIRQRAMQATFCCYWTDLVDQSKQCATLIATQSRTAQPSMLYFECGFTTDPGSEFAALHKREARLKVEEKVVSIGERVEIEFDTPPPPPPL